MTVGVEKEVERASVVMDDFDLLRRMEPEGDDEAAARDIARSRLRAAIAAERRTEDRSIIAGVGSWWAQHLPTVPGLRLGAVATAVAIVLALVVAVSVLAPAPDAARLGEMADIAEVAPMPAPTAGTWLYSRSVETTAVEVATRAGSLVIVSPAVVERWLDAGGHAAVRTTRGDPEFLDRTAAVAFADSGVAGMLGAEQIVRADAGEGDGFAGIAATEEGVQDYIRNRVADEPSPDQTLDVAAEILAAPAAPPELRAAVFRVLERLQGIAVGVDDAAGEVTVRYRFDDAGGTLERRLVFVVGTSRLVRDSLAVLSPIGEVPAGTALRDARYDASRVVTAPPPGARAGREDHAGR